MSFLGDAWGEVESFFSGLFSSEVAPNETSISLVAPDIGLPSTFGIPSLDFGALVEPVEEVEDDPLKDEKKAAALAARALQVQEQGRTGRSSTFLTRGMTLGAAPARRSFLTRGL